MDDNFNRAQASIQYINWFVNQIKCSIEKVSINKQPIFKRFIYLLIHLFILLYYSVCCIENLIILVYPVEKLKITQNDAYLS